jgi:hypothetical protein
MSSKRRLRRKKCTRKIKHDSEDAALAIIKKMRKTGTTKRLRAYKCNFCGGWHVGQPNARIRQSIRARRGDV